MNVTVRNVITSMRAVSWFDWAQFVESVSLVDEVLRARSPFGDMDFATRDRYRHAVEELARSSGLTEVEVAERAIAMADAAPSADDGGPAPAVRCRDPGYYLISDGRSSWSVPSTPGSRWRAGCDAPMSGPARAGISARSHSSRRSSSPSHSCCPATEAHRVPRILVVAVLALGPAFDLAIALVNRSVT